MLLLARTNLGLGTGDSPTFAGLTTTGDVSFGDNDKAIFGAGSDLQIYHDGSNSYVSELGTGELILLSNGSTVNIQATPGAEYMARFYRDAQVELYYDNAKKLATTSTGIDVTGTVTADGLTVDGDVTLNQGSGDALSIFRSTDYATLKIGADSSNHWYMQEVGSNDLYLARVNAGVGDYAAKFASNGDISFYEDTGTTPKFFWDASAESLGIGTTVPTRALHVNAGTANEVARFESTDTEALIELVDSTGSAQIRSRNDLRFYTNGGSTRAMDIDSSGNVGIGTSSPVNKLSVSGSGSVANFNGTSSDVSFSLTSSNSSGTGYIQYSGDNLNFWTNNSERLRIDSSGNLLVGTTSPYSVSKTTIDYSSNGAFGITLRDTGSAAEGAMAYFVKGGAVVGSVVSNTSSTSYNTSTTSGITGVDANNVSIRTNNTEAMRIDASGNLLVGTTSGSDKVTVNGTVSATNFNTTSDATLKTNVETLTGSLDAVNALRGVSFDWIESGGSEVGFIAQEVEEVLPEVVSTNDQGIKSVKYGNMVAVLVEAIKEQQLRIEALEAKLEG